MDFRRRFHKYDSLRDAHWILFMKHPFVINDFLLHKPTFAFDEACNQL